MEQIAAKEFEESFVKENYVEDGQNKLEVKCKHCNSKILLKKSAAFFEQEINIPIVQQKVGGDVADEPVQLFWHVNNMYTFENIGFSHTVKNFKYLTCADCEIGPIGYHDIATQQNYVCIARVDHV